MIFKRRQPHPSCTHSMGTHVAYARKDQQRAAYVCEASIAPSIATIPTLSAHTLTCLLRPSYPLPTCEKRMSMSSLGMRTWSNDM